MREPLPKRYKTIIRVVLTIIACTLLFYFFLARIGTVKNGFLAFLSVLAPFLAGALIAFLLKPVQPAGRPARQLVCPSRLP